MIILRRSFRVLNEVTPAPSSFRRMCSRWFTHIPNNNNCPMGEVEEGGETLSLRQLSDLRITTMRVNENWPTHTKQRGIFGQLRERQLIQWLPISQTLPTAMLIKLDLQTLNSSTIVKSRIKTLVSPVCVFLIRWQDFVRSECTARTIIVPAQDC